MSPFTKEPVFYLRFKEEKDGECVGGEMVRVWVMVRVCGWRW